MKQARSTILATSADALFHTAVLFSVFLLLRGHNAPGGGFVGGLVAGAALVLRYLDAGPDRVETVPPVSAQTLLGVGLGLALVSGAAGWLAGGSFLEMGKFSADVPLLGTVKTTGALPFDIGVFLIVVGLVAGLLRALGREGET